MSDRDVGHASRPLYGGQLCMCRAEVCVTHPSSLQFCYGSDAMRYRMKTTELFSPVPSAIFLETLCQVVLHLVFGSLTGLSSAAFHS